MDKETYSKRMVELKSTHKDAIRKLNIEYVEAHRKYSVGDVLRTPRFIIRVEDIGYNMAWTSSKVPVVIYGGPLLRKKDLKPYTSGEHYTVFEHEDIEKLN